MILKLELENYIPLTVSGISKITLTLGEIVNLLISLNGAGKSTLLTQMNALPAENADFINGRKYVEILLNKKLYKLESTTGKNGTHSFKIDNGEELNTSGTISVQKRLVQQHFKLTPGLARVLTGIKGGDVLSNLSINRRKEIFMELYPNDVDYALGVYNKLKTERNNLKGAIKNQQRNLAAETDKLITLHQADYEDSLDDHIARLENDIKDGLLISGSLAQYHPQPQKETVIKQFQGLVRKLTLTGISAKPSLPPGVLQSLIASRTETLATFTSSKDIYGRLLAEARCQIEELGQGNVVDPIAFKDHLTSVTEEITRVQCELTQVHQRYETLPYFATLPYSSELSVITDEFISYLRRVVNAGVTDLTSTLYQSWLQEKDTLQTDLTNTEKDIHSLTHKLNHIRNMETLDCPECKHTFKQGFTESDIRKLEFSLKQLIERQTVLMKRLDEVTNKVTLEGDWYYTMKQLNNYLRSNGHVKGLYDLVKTYNVGKFDSPLGQDVLVDALITHQNAFKLSQQLTALETEKDSLEARLELLNRVDEHGLFKKVKEFEEQFEFYSDAIEDLKQKISNLKQELDTATEYQQELMVLEHLKGEVLTIIENEFNVKLKRVLDNKLNLLGEEKNRLMRDMIRKASLDAVIEKITENLAALKRREILVTKLMEGLCPNKGLIGRLMADFIKTVCGNMNAMIKELWNGTLYVKPCAKENGDLTYKFPVVNGHNKETPDIEDCSDGQCDIINFVFRKVMLKYHDGGFPLIMDEIGVKFDEINRNRFFSYINEYVSSGESPQLFMISHYVSQYESFKHANIIALKYDGLTIHGEVNKNTVIA